MVGFDLSSVGRIDCPLSTRRRVKEIQGLIHVPGARTFERRQVEARKSSERPLDQVAECYWLWVGAVTDESQE